MSEHRPDWLTVSDYARIYGVDRGTVYKWLKQGDILETYKVHSLRRVRNIPPREKNTQPSVDGR